MKSSKASVIVPAYNSEKTIGKCLRALKTQSKKPLEIIVVDDGSQDSTLQRAGEFQKGKPGVKILKQKHAGPASARNRGAKTARGDIVLFTDADCIPERDWLREMLKPFQDNGTAGVQGSYCTEQKSLTANFAQFEIEKRYERLSSRKYIDFIGTYSAAYRRSIFLKFRGFDEGFPEASGEDPELSFRLSSAGYRLVFNPRARVCHTHPDTLGRYLRQKFGRARWRIPLYKKHPGKAVSESYTPQGLKIQIGLFYLFILFLVLSLFSPGLIYTSISLLILLFVSTIPFSVQAGGREKRLGLASPFILVLRSAVFSLGLLYGAIKSI